MLEFSLEPSNLLVHSVAPSLLRVNMNLTIFGVLHCLLIICLRNACLIFFLPKDFNFEAHVYPAYTLLLASSKTGLFVPIFVPSKNQFNSFNDYWVSSISQGP